jgi:acyl-CoA carboxylase epsilon subunit-like protein
VSDRSDRSEHRETVRGPTLQVIDRDATAEEVAAIVVAITSLVQREALVAGTPASPLDAWVRASRLGSRRLGFQRGPWRLSGRMARRSPV